MNNLKYIGEFDLIQQISQLFQPNNEKKNENIIKGIGDDCAVLSLNKDKVLLVTTDLLMEKTHFLLNTISAYQLAKKSLIVNLSDVAAMGATPIAFFLALALPIKLKNEWLEEFFKGLHNTALEYKIDLLGGDTIASKNDLVINIMLLAEADKNKILYRNNAQIGDAILVTGNLGNSASGLKILENSNLTYNNIEKILIKTHLEPIARVKEGQIIAENGLANSMQDISDGLIGDLNHICTNSNVGALLYERKLPISEELILYSQQNKINPLDFVLYGGEDYELLLTVPQVNVSHLEELIKKETDIKLYKIGEIIEEKGIKLLQKNNKIEILNNKGYNHFT